MLNLIIIRSLIATETVSPMTIANVDNNVSKEVKLIVIIFSAFAIAPAEQELSDTIETGSRVGFVLSNVT